MESVSMDVGETVLSEFSQMTAAAKPMASGGVEHARRLVLQSLGAEPARRIIDRVMRSADASDGFASLGKANPQQLSKFILGEHPQTIAAHPGAPQSRQRRAAGVVAAGRAARRRADAHGEHRRDPARGDRTDLERDRPAAEVAGRPVARAAWRREGRGRVVQPARPQHEPEGARDGGRARARTSRCRFATSCSCSTTWRPWRTTGSASS